MMELVKQMENLKKAADEEQQRANFQQECIDKDIPCSNVLKEDRDAYKKFITDNQERLNEILEAARVIERCGQEYPSHW